MILTPKNAGIQRKRNVIGLCASDNAGMSNHPRLVLNAKEGLERYEMYLAHFICGNLGLNEEPAERAAQSGFQINPLSTHEHNWQKRSIIITERRKIWYYQNFGFRS